MGNSSGDSGDGADSFLRAVAEVPERAPESMPARIAHFRVLGRLGRGGMGVVYRAQDETLRREVALKLLPEATEDDEARQRFLREARAAAGITHPNVAVVHQVGEADGRVYIAMELVDGESLRHKLEGGPLDTAVARDLATQIARGLAAAHERGLVHRDLKPENVMITPAGVVKLLDFGLAKSTREDARPHDADLAVATTETLVTSDTGRVMGTPAYMSPEQATGEPLDVRSDVFTFGVVLYEMLTGVRPFTGNNTGAVLVAIARDPPSPLGERAPQVDEETEAVVMRCLAKAAAERFANAGEIVAALSGKSPPSAELRSSGSAVAVSRSGATSRPRSRAAAFAVAFVAVGAVAASVWWPRAASTRQGAASASAASSGSARAPALTRIVDLPPPKTNVPEAATEYKAAVQAIYDNTWFIAANHLLKAVTLDPSMAEAHLRLSLLSVTARDPDLRSAEFEKAAGLRAQLSERDQAFMEAMQPFLQSHVQDVAEADKRMRALAQRYPNDTEILMWLTGIHYFTPESLPIAEQALALDPHDPYEWEVKADALLVQGKFDEAHAAYEKCGEYSIDGAECFAIMGWGDRSAGKCADYERDLQRAADRSPFWLGMAITPMASTGTSTQTLQEKITQAIPAMPPLFGPEFQRLEFEARLAILAGDFPRAEMLAKKGAAALSADPMLRSIYWLQLQSTAQLLDIALESGDTVATQRIASDFVARSSAWSIEYFTEQGVDIYLAVARLAFPANEPPPAAFEAARQAWIKSRLAAGAYKGAVWTYAYAIPALTASEAQAAIDALAQLGPSTPTPSFGGISLSGREGSPDAAVGHVYMLLGRTDEAIEHLKRGAAACDLFDSTIDHVRASLDLGAALERKGDRQGACDAYRSVLRVWGNAKPRSVTADAARARSTALGCPRDG